MCGGSLRGFAPDEGRGGEDKGLCGETTFPAVLNRGTGNWAGSSGATKSLTTTGKGVHGRTIKGEGEPVPICTTTPLSRGATNNLTQKTTNTI